MAKTNLTPTRPGYAFARYHQRRRMPAPAHPRKRILLSGLTVSPDGGAIAPWQAAQYPASRFDFRPTIRVGRTCHRSLIGPIGCFDIEQCAGTVRGTRQTFQLAGTRSVAAARRGCPTPVFHDCIEPIQRTDRRNGEEY